MWIGERITESGIGNGISLLIFAGITANIATSALAANVYYLFKDVSQVSIPAMIASVVVFVILILGIVFVELGERRIPIQYSKRMVGRRDVRRSVHAHSAEAERLRRPAADLRRAPSCSSRRPFWRSSRTLPRITGGTNNVSTMSWGYQLIFALMIFGFTFFYSAISFNPVEISKNIQNNGGMIPGIRQGKPTSDFIKKISTRITTFGAIYLAVLAVIPDDHLRHRQGISAVRGLLSDDRRFRRDGNHASAGEPDADASLQGLPEVIAEELR